MPNKVLIDEKEMPVGTFVRPAFLFSIEAASLQKHKAEILGM